jgi:hypothetical protein
VLEAMGEVLARLEVEAEHVIFGHSHRAGPLPGDLGEEWITPSGTRLHNSGSWVYQSAFLSPVPGESPFWPGAAVRVRDGKPPELLRLLDDLGHEEISGALAAERARSAQRDSSPGVKQTA